MPRWKQEATRHLAGHHENRGKKRKAIADGDYVMAPAYERSPRRRRASWMSLDSVANESVRVKRTKRSNMEDIRMVTRLAWMAHKLVSSKSETR